MTTSKTTPSSAGFSLIEISVVLLITGLLLAGILTPLSSQRESAKIKDTQRQMLEIKDALLGFAAVNGRLPCPTLQGNNGNEMGGDVINCTDAGGVEFNHGFIPVNTLGLSGAVDGNGLLLDAWNNPLRYSVTRSDVDLNGAWDFIQTGEMSAQGMGALTPDLIVCASASTLPNACFNADAIAGGVPLVFYSLGSRAQTFVSPDQSENAGEATNVNRGGLLIAGDNVFVSKETSITNATEFDDLVDWLSPNVLYGRMLQARQLP